MVYSVINGVVCLPSKREESLIKIIIKKKYKKHPDKAIVRNKKRVHCA